MQIDVQLGGRDLGVSLAPALDAWTAAEPMTAALHSGDVGWHLRFDDEALEGAFRLWMVDGAPAAAGLVDGGVLRMAFAPDRVGDGDLAAAVAAGLEDIAYVEIRVEARSARSSCGAAGRPIPTPGCSSTASSTPATVLSRHPPPTS